MKLDRRSTIHCVHSGSLCQLRRIWGCGVFERGNEKRQSDDISCLGRDGVAYSADERGPTQFAEVEEVGEELHSRRLMRRQGTSAEWVDEPAAPTAGESARESGGWPIPMHTPVHGVIGVLLQAMAIWTLRIWKVV